MQMRMWRKESFGLLKRRREEERLQCGTGRWLVVILEAEPGEEMMSPSWLKETRG